MRGSILWGVALAAALAAPGSAQTLPGQLTAADIAAPVWTGGLVDNAAFVPPEGAAAAHEPFTGTLTLSETEMATEPAELTSRDVLGRDPKIFPAVALSFFTHGSDLVPTTQDVIRAGTGPNGRSYWDIIVQPGRVWSDPADGGWSRASFPFSLMQSIEGETHNGVATFLYKGAEVSNLHFQIVQQTSPYYVVDFFTASGNVPVSYDPTPPADVEALSATWEQALADATPIGSWAELGEKVGTDALAGFDETIVPSEIVLDGIAVDGTFYIKSCPSAAGELAYCDRQRFGVWSVTKSAANAVALLRLAQKYGIEVFDAKLADYLPEAAAYPGWRDVTFGDALNMATGVGNGSTKTDPNDIGDGELDDTYPQWYEARSEQEKIDTILRIAGVYPWGPGKVARYRDQDMFMLGAAMDAFLKAKEGPDADLWTMLETEVYAPIGIHYAPINRTIEPDGSEGQPLMAFGFYPTVGDLVKIAELYLNRGEHDGVQILSAEGLEDILAGSEVPGLPTGDANQPWYHKAFWYSSIQATGGCTLYYPMMSGWGGNYVLLMPGHLVPVRLAKNWSMEAPAFDVSSLAAVADRLTNFCE